jgi:hypothetical protein
LLLSIAVLKETAGLEMESRGDAQKFVPGYWRSDYRYQIRSFRAHHDNEVMLAPNS